MTEQTLAVTAECVDPLEILKRYQTEAIPPHLGQTALSAVLAFFEAQALSPVAGIVPNSSGAFGSMPETQSLLAECRNQLRIRGSADLPPGSFVGPHVLGDVYYGAGISLWVPGPAGQVPNELT